MNQNSHRTNLLCKHFIVIVSVLLTAGWFNPLIADNESRESRNKKDQYEDKKNHQGKEYEGKSHAIYYKAPAGDLPATQEAYIDGVKVAVLPNGRVVTPAGVEVIVDAPKPYGLAMSKDGKILATINSGASRFSVSLITNLSSATPTVNRVNINATFMGVVFSPDGSRFYVAGGENGNIWVGDTANAKIIGSVNLNGEAHPLDRPLDVVENPTERFKGAFPGNMVLSKNGHYLYVVDQASFSVFVIDTRKIITGTDTDGKIEEPDNFKAVLHSVKAGRYPYGITLSKDNKTLFVTNVGVFQYSHLRPEILSGDRNVDYPLCFPAHTYPDNVEDDLTVSITKVDPRNLDDSLQDLKGGIRCGYVAEDMQVTVPGLGDPNAPESSSVYVMDVSNPEKPVVMETVKTGPLIGDMEEGIEAYSGSHPNSVAVGKGAIYVANGNNDAVSVLHPNTYKELSRIKLRILRGKDKRLKGIQPVALALSPNHKYLYVAEAGLNAVAVVRLDGKSGKVIGHIPTGWWPSAIQVSPNGKKLYVANARGRGALPTEDFAPNNLGAPKHSMFGTVSIIDVPDDNQLELYTDRVLTNNGFVKTALVEQDGNHPIPTLPSKRSKQIKHVIFINKENATHDLLLGHITVTRKGVPVNGEPRYSLGYDAAPNHHELALSFAFSDNFFLEPSVSADGHRWLTNMYTTEFEETHWPASYGGKRRDSGQDAEVIANFPGRIGFTDATGTPDPHDYNQHGGIYLHLHRNDRTFINFGNGFEFTQVDGSYGTEPTGARENVNVPMEKIVYDNTDHMFPTYNTRIPDALLPEDPTRFSRFGRFKQSFEAHYVDREKGQCMLPDYVDLYYPNDHGGGAFNINPNGPAWDFVRYIQDNDAALGMTVDLISHSPCWKDTVIFVMEDDTQNGFDHVDGHRSIFMVISPWAQREYLSKSHTSLSSIFKTIYLILGIPPLNQYDAAATDLRDMFTSEPDFTPYDFQDIHYVKGASKEWIALTKDIRFDRPDADEVKLRAAIAKTTGIPRQVTTASESSNDVSLTQ